jgi:hypothetical protein
MGWLYTKNHKWGALVARQYAVLHGEISCMVFQNCTDGQAIENTPVRVIGEDPIVRFNRTRDLSSRAFYGTLLTSWAGDGSCEVLQPPPSAWIKPSLAVIC